MTWACSKDLVEYVRTHVFIYKQSNKLPLLRILFYGKILIPSIMPFYGTILSLKSNNENIDIVITPEDMLVRVYQCIRQLVTYLIH